MARNVISSIQKKLKDADKLEKKLSKLRDKIRAKVDELEDIIESIDVAHEGFEHGLLELNGAVDTMSQFV